MVNFLARIVWGQQNQGGQIRWGWKGVLLEGVLVANGRNFFMRVTKLKPTLGSPLVSNMSLTRTF